MSRATQKRKKKTGRTAATSDIHELYELSVQDPTQECDLIEKVWSEQRGRKCQHIREDFCGTAVVSMEWVKRRRDHTAIGVDIDRSVLAWGMGRMADRLTAPQRERVTLLEGDVLRVQTDPVDAVLAMNFSYFLLKRRDDLLGYFQSVHRALVDDGLFLLDAYGGSDAFLELEEEREIDGFTYVWDQNTYSPVTGEATNYIHFRFPDGSEIEQAFSYSWRLWTLPEVQEILREAGFKKAVVYWEGTDPKTNEGNGEWAVTETGDADHGWIAYLVALK